MTKRPNKKLISKQKKNYTEVLLALRRNRPQASGVPCGLKNVETLNQCLKLTIIVEDT